MPACASATTSRCPTATRRCSRSSRSTSDRSIALGTKQGVVKRVSAGAYPNKPEFEVIGLKAGDEVVGVVQGDETDELVFVASDAQLLRFPAASVRPQGCPAGGMAGINLASGAARHPLHERATRSTPTTPSSSRSPRAATRCSAPTPAARRSASSRSSPAKGRATGGVRAQRFLKGEDALHLAWVGRSPALAVGTDGSARQLPDVGAKRDASGQPLEAAIAAVGAQIG